METLYIVGGIFVVAVISVIVINNSIIAKFNTVQQAWSDILAAERVKLKLIPELEKALQDHKAFEGEILTKVTELRSSLNKATNARVDDAKAMQALAAVEANTQQLMSGLHLAVEAYPELKSVELFGQYMNSLEECIQDVGAAIRLFNSNVNVFNTSIEVFPNSFVNAVMTNKNRIEPFSDSAAQGEIEYKPNF